MTGRARRQARQALAVLAAVAVVYAAYPYVTLFRLGQAIRHGDASALEALVDWDGVREGLKEDICDDVLDEPAEAKRDEAALPPFGEGFVKGVAGNVIDENITPHALVSAAHDFEIDKGRPIVPQSDEQPRIVWAFFDALGSFSILLRPPGDDIAPIRIRMQLQDGVWKVTRAWLPHELLQRANNRT